MKDPIYPSLKNELCYFARRWFVGSLSVSYVNFWTKKEEEEITTLGEEEILFVSSNFSFSLNVFISVYGSYFGY